MSCLLRDENDCKDNNAELESELEFNCSTQCRAVAIAINSTV